VDDNFEGSEVPNWMKGCNRASLAHILLSGANMKHFVKRSTKCGIKCSSSGVMASASNERK
jgi:hypothetical protein